MKVNLIAIAGAGILGALIFLISQVVPTDPYVTDPEDWYYRSVNNCDWVEDVVRHYEEEHNVHISILCEE